MAMTTTRSTDPRIRFRHTVPDVYPATSFSVHQSGMTPGSTVYEGFVHAPAHNNVWHGAAGLSIMDPATPVDDPLRVWDRERPTVANGRIQVGTPAHRKGKVTAGNVAVGGGRSFGWFGESWNAQHIDERRGIGIDITHRGGTSQYYVPWRQARQQGVLLEAPPNGTGVILRPNHGAGQRPDGLMWDNKARGTFRSRYRGPRQLRRGHPLGVPLGGAGFEDWVDWDGTATGPEWYPIPEFQLFVKMTCVGLRSLDDIGWGPGVANHAEYIFAYSPMPPHPATGDPQPSMLEQLLAAGCNWGHPDNCLRGVVANMPTMETGYGRKAEGIVLSVDSATMWGALQIPAHHPDQGPTDTSPVPPPPVVPAPSPTPTDPAPGPGTEPPPDDAVDVDADLAPIRGVADGLALAAVELRTAADNIDVVYGDGVEQ